MHLYNNIFPFAYILLEKFKEEIMVVKKILLTIALLSTLVITAACSTANARKQALIKLFNNHSRSKAQYIEA